MAGTAAHSASDASLSWHGRPSQFLNLPRYLLAAVVAAAPIWALVMPPDLSGLPGGSNAWAPAALQYTCFGLLGLLGLLLAYSWLSLRSISYRINDGSLEISKGILSRTTDLLELHRVRDISTVRPFALRLVGLGHIHLQTSDRSHPEVDILAQSGVMDLVRDLRAEVEQRRLRARVVGIDNGLEG